MVETPAEAAARTRRSRARSQARRDEEAAAALQLAAEAEADENRAERMAAALAAAVRKNTPAAAKPGPKRTPAQPDQGASMTDPSITLKANEAAIAKAVERGAVPIAEAERWRKGAKAGADVRPALAAVPDNAEVARRQRTLAAAADPDDDGRAGAASGSPPRRSHRSRPQPRRRCVRRPRATRSMRPRRRR